MLGASNKNQLDAGELKSLGNEKDACRREAPVDGSLGHLGRPEGKRNDKPTGRRPRRCRRAKISEDDGAAHAFDAKQVYTDLL